MLDEIEKAHAEVINVLLQVLDDGRLTDAKGRTVNFSNTLIIMTSNLGAQHLLDAAAAGGGPDADALARGRVMADVRRFFRPELLNRLDDIIVFEPLSREMLRAVARCAADDITRRLAKKGIQLKWSDDALDLAARESFEPAFGARPLRRWLERHVVTDLSLRVIRREVAEGCHVRVHATDGALRYEVTQPPAGHVGTKRPKPPSGGFDDLQLVASDAESAEDSAMED